jgi:hypothetical protein
MAEKIEVRFERMKDIMLRFMDTVHDVIVDISDESKPFYKLFMAEIEDYQKQIIEA